MSVNHETLLDRFRHLRVIVVGDSMLDSYVDGASSRLCPEGPVPIVSVHGERSAPGGAANTAMNARALGAEVALFSLVGQDAAGAEMVTHLQSAGVATDHVLREPERRTLVKERIFAGRQLLARLDHGGEQKASPTCERQLAGALSELACASDAILVSDYGYGVITPALIGALARLPNPPVLVVDSKRLPAFRECKPTAVKPNFEQALALFAGRVAPRACRVEQIRALAGDILRATGARIAAVTLDADGALILEGDRPAHRTFARPAPNHHAAGAGDTFTSGLALALAAGCDSALAGDIAAAAAAVVVGKERTAVCTAQELRGQRQCGPKTAAALASLKAQVEQYRLEGRRIVLTNGCFDILHRGHVTYLAQARALGDVLIVGVNSDQGIRRLKGPGRPVNTLADRLHVLAALEPVNHLIAFDEDTPHALIAALKPDVFVKGGDYTRERLPEAALVEELGGVVRILPLVEAVSTTTLLTRIRTPQPARLEVAS